MRLIEAACTPPGTAASGFSAREAGVGSGTSGAVVSLVLTSERPSARLPTRYVASKPFARTVRAAGRKSPPKLGLGQRDLTVHRVSPARGARLSAALPRKP